MVPVDTDIIRGLGFVTLYAAYAEEEVDCILEILSRVEPFGDEERRWPLGRKLRHAKRLVERLNSSDSRIQNLIDALSGGPDLFERRNEVIHGCIYPSHYGTDELHSGRPNVPTRTVDAKELYNLAEDFEGWASHIYLPRLFAIHHAVAAHVRANP